MKLQNHHYCVSLAATRRNILQHTATHGNTLQHAAAGGSTTITIVYLLLQRTATHCNALQHTATHCNTPHHTTTHCNTQQHTAAHCSILQHTATHCSTLQHTATHCSTLQHTATYCSTLQHTTTKVARQSLFGTYSTNFWRTPKRIQMIFLLSIFIYFVLRLSELLLSHNRPFLAPISSAVDPLLSVRI